MLQLVKINQLISCNSSQLRTHSHHILLLLSIFNLLCNFKYFVTTLLRMLHACNRNPRTIESLCLLLPQNDWTIYIQSRATNRLPISVHRFYSENVIGLWAFPISPGAPRPPSFPLHKKCLLYFFFFESQVHFTREQYCTVRIGSRKSSSDL